MLCYDMLCNVMLGYVMLFYAVDVWSLQKKEVVGTRWTVDSR